MELLSLSGRRSSARNVPSGEERGEADVFAGYVSGSDRLFFFDAFYDLSYSCLLQEDSNVCLLPSTKIPLIIVISFEGYWNTLPQRHICNHQNTLSKVIQTQKIGVYTT